MQSQNRQWSWMDCNLTIKRHNKKNSNQIFQILESQYSIQLQEDKSEAELNISISMEKMMNYEQGNGFTWHKTWKIPSIEVKISKRDINAIKDQLGVTRIYCEITSGYPVRNVMEYYMQEVSLQGDNKKQLGSSGAIHFNNLKFSQTSFKHQRNKFSLIIILFTKNQQCSRSILKSFISMPIYVDSRKQARKKQPRNVFVSQLIPVQVFQEQPQQRHSKKQIRIKAGMKKLSSQPQLQTSQGQSKYIMKQSLAGFIIFYKSANIRNKIKHPFYFSYHFHKLITLYYNREFANSPFEALKSIERLQKNNQKKFLLVAFLPAIGQEKQQVLQDLKKQIVALFQNSWKYFFIEIVIKDSVDYNQMIQQKVNLQDQKADQQAEKQIKKWIQLTPHQILAAYSEYYTDFQNRVNRKNEENKDSLKSEQLPPNENQVDNLKLYEHFQLHQVIQIQSAFKNSQPCKKVKVQTQQKEHHQQQK